MSFSLIRGSAIDVCLELLHEVLVGKIFLFLFLLLNTILLRLNFNLINDIQSSTIISLQISPTKLEDHAFLLTWLEKAVTDVRHNVLFLDLFKMRGNFHTESGSMLSHTHELLYLLEVVLGSIVLMLFQHLDVGAAVALSHMLNKVRAIADLLAFQSVNEWTVPFIETI